jgi:hypothetical protein
MLSHHYTKGCVSVKADQGAHAWASLRKVDKRKALVHTMEEDLDDA